MLVIHMILREHWALMVSNCTVLGLMRHPQLNICHAIVLEVTICILLFVIILSRWWMTIFVTFDLLFKLVLTYKALMLCCIVVIWENLRQQHVHVICLSLIWAIRHVCMLLSIDLLSLCLLWNLLLHALISQVKHFPCEGLCHYSLARDTSRIARIPYSVRSVRFLLLLLFNKSCRIISCVLRGSTNTISSWQMILVLGPTWVVKTCCSLESSAGWIYASHIYSRSKTSLGGIKVGSSLESLIHLSNLLLHGNILDCSQFTMVLCWWMTLCHALALLLCYFYCCILCIDTCKGWSNAIGVKCLSHLNCSNIDRLNLLIIWCDCFRRHWNNVCHSLLNCRVSSCFMDVIYAIVLCWVIATLTALISVLYCLSTLWSAVRRSEQLLCWVHWKLKSLGEVAF